MFRRFFVLLMCILFVLSTVACSETMKKPIFSDNTEDDEPGTLRFDSDGKFKIIFFSDLHSDIDNAVWMMEAMLESELPDLVVFSGDTNFQGTSEEVSEVLDALLAPVIERNIPWCHVFGNHDREGELSAEELYALYQSYEYCISSDVEELDGIGTYYLPVLASDSDNLAYVIWAMDSHDYIDGIYENGYDCVHADQVEWYKNTSAKIESDNGKKINGLMFMHIPLQEYRQITDNPIECEMDGYANWNPNASSYDYGLYDAIKERGDVTIVISGHDHVNTFVGKYDGITMAYAGSLTRLSAYSENLRGVRVVVIDENNTSNPTTYFLSAHDRLYKFYRVNSIYGY